MISMIILLFLHFFCDDICIFARTQDGTSTSITNDETGLQTKFCEEYQWYGIIVPRTLACSETEIPCPDSENSKGIIKLKCNCETNEWEHNINTINCTHKWIELLNELIDDDYIPLEDISQKWAQFLQNSAKKILFGGDLLGSVEIGEKILSLARIQYTVTDDSEEQNEVLEFVKIYGKAGNSLLSNYAINVWMTLPDDIRIPKVSSLISLLEQSAAFLAQFMIEEQKRMEYDNWAFEVQAKQPILQAVNFNERNKNNKEPLLRTINSNEPNKNNKLKLLQSSIIFDTVTSTSAPANFTDSNGNVTFNFPFSPMVLMPPLKILQKSMQTTFLGSMFSSSGLSRSPRPRILPPEFISSFNRKSLLLTYCLFKSAGELLNANRFTIVNSLLISASVNDPMKSIVLPENYPINFKFYHIKTNGVSNPRCVFWDTFKKSWSMRGCKTLLTSNDSTECSCTHLTSFAILMDITGSYDHNKRTVINQILNLTTTIGCIFSIICLFLASLVFTCFRSLWNVRHMIHANLCFCLLLAELIFVIGINRTENKTLCRTVAVALHYLFLAAFSWMLLEGYQLYLMLVQVFEDDNGKTILYCLSAYGFPAIIVAVSVGVAWSNYGTDQYCWLNVETQAIWTFAGPVAVVIVCNIVFLGVALRVVLSVPSYHRSRAKRILGWLKGSATLLCLLGITWIFGYLMIIQGAETVFAIIFTVLNCFQGAFIFIVHVILNDSVRFTLLRFIRMNICCISADSTNTPSVINNNRQKLIDKKNDDLSRVLSQPTTGSVNLKSIKWNKEKGMFVEKVSSKMNGKESPTTLITYLEWKGKASNDSISSPSDDSGNYDCQNKETSLVSTGEIIGSSRKNSNNCSDKSTFTVRRNRSKSKQKRSSDASIIIERF